MLYPFSMRRSRWRQVDDPAIIAAELVLYQGLYDARCQVSASPLACPGCGLSTVEADGANSRWARIVCDGCGRVNWIPVGVAAEK